MYLYVLLFKKKNKKQILTIKSYSLLLSLAQCLSISFSCPKLTIMTILGNNFSHIWKWIESPCFWAQRHHSPSFPWLHFHPKPVPSGCITLHPAVFRGSLLDRQVTFDISLNSRALNHTGRSVSRAEYKSCTPEALYPLTDSTNFHSSSATWMWGFLQPLCTPAL